MPPPRTCRVWIAASDPTVRAALKGLVEASTDLGPAAGPADGDVAIADGLEMLQHTSLPAVVLVDGVPGPVALAEGARGVLPRETDAPRLIAAVLAVRSGLTVMDVEYADAVIPAQAARPTSTLTSREAEVLRLMAEGRSNKEIGSSLDISQHTAKFHVNGILAKLGAGTRTEAVVRAAQQGWLLL